MRVSEWVAAGYFAYLTAVALVRLTGPRRLNAGAAAAVAAIVVGIPATLPGSPTLSFIRDWLPALHLLVGYWLSGFFFVAPMQRIEERFLAVDRWLYRIGLERVVARTPRVLLELLELAYLTCFLFVPGGMLLLASAGDSAAADRYWTLVLASEFGSFGMLPWIQTRPPRRIEPPTAIDRRTITMRRLNNYINNETSIGANTFPSGHVAGSLMTALAVSALLPALTWPLMLAAGLITISTVVGRYHYAVDAVAGAALTMGIWLYLRI